MKPTIDLKAPNHNLPSSLLCPIAAMDLEAILNHVGSYKFLEGTNEQALLVEWTPYDVNLTEKIKNLDHHHNLHQPQQVWVKVAYKNYRKAYFEQCNEVKKDKNTVVDHIFNRKLATIWNYQYLRLIHVARGNNSSSGRGQETFGVALMKDDAYYRAKVRKRSISYADPFDLVKIVNQKVGTKHFINVSDMFSYWY